MRTLLACAGIDGHGDAVDRLEALARERNPDAILFAGGLFSSPVADESATASAERHHENMRLLERFFATLGALRIVATVVPGPVDAPLRAFLMAGMHARSQSPGVHLVHCTMVTTRDIVIAGIGGELTQAEDSGEPFIRCSRTTAAYFLQAFDVASESKKVLLLSSSPQGGLGGDRGNAIAGDLIDTYHPKLCVVAGPDSHRGVERLAHTTVVNPGRLSHAAAAWIDWGREVDEQVEMIDLSASQLV